MTPAEQLERYLNIIRSSRRNVRPEEIREFLTEQAVAEAARDPEKWDIFTLTRIKLAEDALYFFCHQVFAASPMLPRMLLLKFWYRCVEKDFRYRSYTGDLTDPLLIDFTPVRVTIAEKHEPGWRILRYLNEGRRTRPAALPDMVAQAMEDDSVPMFAIGLDMTGFRFSFNFLEQLILQGKYGILGYLLKNKRISRSTATPGELCAYAVSRLEDSLSLPFLRTVEESLPGCIRKFRDPFGRNLLWYAMYNRETIWFHPASRLVPALLDYGCDPDNRNQAGLPWRLVRDNIPEKYRQLLGNAASEKLRELQPIEGLRQDAADEGEDALKLVSGWSGTEVIGEEINATQVSFLIRGGRDGHFSPSPEIRIKLHDLMNELFWDRVRHPELLPESWRKKITDASGIGDFPAKTEKPIYAIQKRGIAIFRTGLLMYHPWVRELYCRKQYPGWKILRHLCATDAPRMPDAMEQKMLECIREDNVSGFRILFTGNGKHCPLPLMKAILEEGASRIREWLLDETSLFAQQYTPEELLFYAAARMEGVKAQELVTSMQSRFSGIATRAKDCFGSNLQWYTIFNPVLRGKREGSLLLQTLEKLGCQTTSVNSFGVAAKDIANLAQECGKPCDLNG